MNWVGLFTSILLMNSMNRYKYDLWMNYNRGKINKGMKMDYIGQYTYEIRMDYNK